MSNRFNVTVCYATKEKQVCLPALVPAGNNLQWAITASGILAEFPEIELTTCRTGVYSTLKPLTYVVEDGDRIEIYRPATGKRKKINTHEK